MSDSEKGGHDARFDPWSGNRFGGVRWLAFSSVAHVAILVVFATITLTVIRKSEEIKVKVVDDYFGAEELVGEPSLQDLAGVLAMEPKVPQRALPGAPRIRNVRAPSMPRIGGFGPKIGKGPAIDTASPAVAFGTGGIGGLSGSFGDYVGGLRKVGLDVALVIDTTDSMQFVIDAVKERLSVLVATIQRIVPTSRIGIVVYRDQGDDYVTKWTDLSFHTNKLRAFLAQITAHGGGDWEEAVRDALEAIYDLSWRKKSKRVIILVGGSPPHAWEVEEVRSLVRDFRSDGGFVSAIDVTKQLHYRFDLQMWRAIQGSKPYEPSPMPEYYEKVAVSFGEIAEDGGGELFELDQGKKLMRQVLQATFGSRWKEEMARHLEELS